MKLFLVIFLCLIRTDSIPFLSLEFKYLLWTSFLCYYHFTIISPGGSDHALYAVDVSDPRKRHVQMYSKKFGHTDWVTSVAHLADGRVISASMDCRLCLWSTDRRSCVDVMGGHDKSISKVRRFTCGQKRS